MGVKENWERIRERICLACKRSGRSPDEVKVLVASKYMDEPTIREIFSLGINLFGENQIQSAKRKISSLKDLSIEWHFIGHLQTNKINQFLALDFAMIHSLDRIDLLYALNKRAKIHNKKVKGLLQVNLHKEKTKHGFTEEDEVFQVFELIKKEMEFIECVGVMTMAPLGADERDLHMIFSRVRRLADALGVPEISMGTSSDFEIAIEEGATIVRIGSAFLDSG